METMACQWSGVAMQTASMFGFSVISRKSLNALQSVLPYFWSTACFESVRRVVSTSQTATT